MGLSHYEVAAAPAAAGPYSHAVAANGFLFTSGILPVDPATGDLAGPGIKEQTQQVMRNIEVVLEAAGLGFGDVVKSTVHLADVQRDFAGFNAVYGGFFDGGHCPARTTVGSRLPKGLVEIDVVAAFPATPS